MNILCIALCDPAPFLTGQPIIAKKTCAGGIASVAFIITAIFAFGYYVVPFVMANVADAYLTIPNARWTSSNLCVGNTTMKAIFVGAEKCSDSREPGRCVDDVVTVQLDQSVNYSSFSVKCDEGFYQESGLPFCSVELSFVDMEVTILWNICLQCSCLFDFTLLIVCLHRGVLLCVSTGVRDRDQRTSRNHSFAVRALY
jgi:hypothetical protein